MFDELVGKMGQKLPNESIEDLDLQAALGAQAFSRYLPSSWKAFMTEGDMEDLLEASIACSIRTASASMRSLNAVKEYKKKMAGEATKAAEFFAVIDGLTMTAESAKATYQQMNQNLVEVERNIAALTKRLNNALVAPGQHCLCLGKDK
ncbi:hypothetical protein Adt_05007 [Abeliophyllum distichum]|uniref:Uncharacterized protein n=1 Tax=Abeliophyllum distichum TaxID=126358 RepID=A0ABD1V2V6_9LAMI